MAGAYFTITYVDSLQGPEGLLVELGGIRKNFVKGLEEDYYIVALLGQVKGEHGEREHLLPMASVTHSGLQVRKWIKRVIAANQVCGHVSGPGFCYDNGVVLKMSDLNVILHELLGEIFVQHSSLFQADVQPLTKIEDKYSVYHSFRGLDSLAIAQKVPSEDIKVSNGGQKRRLTGQASLPWK
jgi:hypothetical protein